MPRQLERELDAGRILRKALVDAELEPERTILVPQHDAGCDRRVAGVQRDDLALAACGHGRGGAADEAGVARMLGERGAAIGLPAARFQRRKTSTMRGDVRGRRRDREADLAVLGETVALPSQLLQLLGAERVAQQFVGVGGGIETGALFGAQHVRRKSGFGERRADRLHRRAFERDVAQHDRARAGCARRVEQGARGVERRAAVDQRRAEIAVGIGRDQHRQRNLQARQADTTGSSATSLRASSRALSAETSLRPRADGIHREFPVGQVVAVRLGGALRRAPASRRAGRLESGASARGRAMRHTLRAVAQCARLVRLPRMRGVADVNHVPFPKPGRRAAGDAGQPSLCERTLDETMKKTVGGERQMPRRALTARSPSRPVGPATKHI